MRSDGASYKRVLIEQKPTLGEQIGCVNRKAFFHLRNIAKVRPYLAPSDANKLILSLVFHLLSYCSALLTGLPPKKSVRTLQLVQNAAARESTLHPF